MTHTPLDAAAIQTLVAEVVRRIVAAQAAPPPQASGSRSVSTSGPATAAVPAAATGYAIAGRVITLAHLERVPAGVKQVTVEAAAVITPSARDRAGDAGIALIREAGAATGVPADRPFMIAQAACQADASGRAAAIARAIPGARQIPASGLADVVAALAVHASQDGARGVLLTGRPSVAVILANRSASLRAVTAQHAAGLAAAATSAAANLLVIDPASFPAATLERLCGDFHRTPSPSLPAELAVSPAGCGCKSHTH
jgi:hypothetical protein